MDQSVKELHRDLTRKYQRHGSRIEQLWRSFDQKGRTEVMEAGAVEVLKDPTDASMGNVYKFMPEWNLRDVTAPSSDFLLDMLKHRAMNPLQTQYTTGVNGGLGDHAHIVEMINKKNLEHKDASKYKNCFTLFFEEDRYGQSYELTAHANKAEFLASMGPAIRAQLVIPQAIGELILARQQYLLQCLNIIVEDILDVGSTTRDQKERPKKDIETATAALSGLSSHSDPKKLDLPALLNSALDQKSSLDEYLDLLRAEPIVLAHELNIWFFTREEIVANERGRMLPAFTDSYISEALFDAVNSTVMHAAIWNYIHRLVALLKDMPNKKSRAIVLQELSNVCVLDFKRTQGMFKPGVATGSGGNKWFKRMPGQPKDSTVRIAMKRKPESLTVENPQLHYMLRLCQTDTTWLKAAEWLQKLEDLHRAHPLEKDNMEEREFEALGDLAIIVTFIKSLSSVTPLPAVSNKKAGYFVAGFLALEEELKQLKTGIDLGDFVIPIDNLLEPGMADGALTALHQYILEKTGTKLGFLFQDLIDDCVSSIHKHNEQLKGKSKEIETPYVVPSAPDNSGTRTQERRQKEKMRPAHSAIYDIAPQAAATLESHPNEASAASRHMFKVKESTSSVFSTLLSRSSAARGSIAWDAFAAAMADVGFGVIPKFGSVFTFSPSEKVPVHRDMTVHRLHGPRIEGWKLLQISQRLKRVFGWDQETFTS